MKVAEKYGPIGKVWMGPYLFIIVTDSDVLEYVLKQCLAFYLRESLFSRDAN
jgi:hypothetical protein